MSLHSLEQLTLVGTGGQINFRIERVNLEEVSVRAARRAGAAITNSAKVAKALSGSVGQNLIGWDVLCQFPCIGRQAEYDPVNPSPHWRIGVVGYKGDTIGALRNRIPLQRGEISAPSQVYFGGIKPPSSKAELVILISIFLSPTAPESACLLSLHEQNNNISTIIKTTFFNIALFSYYPQAKSLK
jgi:hypothetical protein